MAAARAAAPTRRRRRSARRCRRPDARRPLLGRREAPEQIAGLGPLQGDRAQALRPIKAEQAGQQPRAEAAVGVVQDDGARAGRRLDDGRCRTPLRHLRGRRRRLVRARAGPPGTTDLAHHRRVHDQVPKRLDRGHVGAAERTVRLHVAQPSARGSRRSPSGTQPMCMTPCMVRLAISAAHSSSSRYSEMKGSASKAGPGGSVAEIGRAGGPAGVEHSRVEPGVGLVPAQPLAELQADVPQRAGGARASSVAGSAAASPSHQNERSRLGPPGVGSAHTSSSRKSGTSSWIRQGLGGVRRVAEASYGTSIHTVAHIYGGV